MKKFVLYLNGFDALSLVSAAVLEIFKEREIVPERIYTCGISSVFATDYAARDENFERRVLNRFSFLSREFKPLLINVATKESILTKLAEFYKFMSSATSKKIKGMVKEKFVLSRLGTIITPKMDIVYSAVNVLDTSEVLIPYREWRVGLRASIAIVPIFAPVEYKNKKLISTAVVTGVPGFSSIENEERLKIFVNTMPNIPEVFPKRTWEIMLKADYTRTTTLIERFSKKFDFFLDFSKFREEIPDFTLNSWQHAKEIAESMISKMDL